MQRLIGTILPHASLPTCLIYFQDPPTASRCFVDSACSGQELSASLLTPFKIPVCRWRMATGLSSDGSSRTRSSNMAIAALRRGARSTLSPRTRWRIIFLVMPKRFRLPYRAATATQIGCCLRRSISSLLCGHCLASVCTKAWIVTSARLGIVQLHSLMGDLRIDTHTVDGQNPAPPFRDPVSPL